MLKLYRRHLKESGRTSMNYRRCRCPVWIIETANGKPVRKSLDTCGWQDAEAKLMRMEPGEILAPTLSQATERFLDDMHALKRSPDTIAKYSLFFKSMAALSEKLREITTDYQSRVREGWKMSPISARKRLERMKTFFRFCRDRGWITSNPASPLKPPKGEADADPPNQG